MEKIKPKKGGHKLLYNLIYLPAKRRHNYDDKREVKKRGGVV